MNLFNLLHLDHPGLINVKEEVERKQPEEALRLLKDYYMKREEPKLSFNDSEKESLIKYAQVHFQEDIDRVIEVAEQVVNQTFIFQEAWDMERTNVPVAFKGKIDWNHIPFEDPEWTFMLNRHRFFIPLGQAYLLTGDERYAHTFCKQLSDWIDSNPHKLSTHTWRTIEVGLRASHWIKAFHYFKNSIHFTPKLFGKMIGSLYEHGQCLADDFTNWKAISNWGVIESKGLFELAIYVSEFLEASKWQQLSLERLKKTARLQVMKDGMHWEQSPMYHNEVLLCYLGAVHLGKNNEIEIDKLIIEAARKMAYADLYMAKPNHHQPMKGDSDDFDLRDIITTAAIVFKDLCLKLGGFSSIDFDNMWSFGVNGINLYNHLPVEKPKNISCGFEDSGNFFMRSGWDENDLYLYFHCGQLGGGHGHADLLHMDVHAFGKDFLMDLGRYNYSDSYPLRKELKRAHSHNTTLVDGIDFTECIDTWNFGRIAVPLAMKWVSEEAFDYVEGSHNGYFHLEDPVYVSRKIIFVKPYYWMLIDVFECKGEHSFSQNFHFAPGEIVLNENTKSCSTQNMDEANLYLIPIYSNQITAAINEGKISYEYNLVEQNKSVQYELKSIGTTAMMQLIYPCRAGDQSMPTVTTVEVHDLLGDVVSENDAQACKICLPHINEEHLIIVCHQKPSLHRMSYVVDGTQIFGEIVLIKRKNGREEVIVVK